MSLISSNRFAYAAYSASEGSMQCWGSSSYGGVCTQAGRGFECLKGSKDLKISYIYISIL